MKMHPVVHFEMPYSDPKRVSKFYEQAFGWNMKYLPDMGKYVLATTSPVDEKQMHLKKGAINGGFYPESDSTGGGIHFVINVDDLKKHMEIVKNAGGEVLGQPIDIPGIGLFVMIKDSEGNQVGILEPINM